MNWSYALICIAFLNLYSCRVDRPIKKPQRPEKKNCSGKAFYARGLCENELNYLRRAANYPDFHRLEDLNRESLLEIYQKTGDINMAAAIFYHRVVTAPNNRRLLRFLERKIKKFKKLDRQNKAPDYSKKKVTLALVPGMFYRDNPDVDADGKSIRGIARAIGIHTIVIPVDQTGTVGENGKFICDYLQYNKRELILASVSKGSSDVKKAMEYCGKKDYFKRVRGWFNIGGITRGNFLIDYLDNATIDKMEARLYFCFKGYNWEGLHSMRSEKGAPLEASISVPSHIMVVSVVGVPLTNHLTERAKPYFEYLKRHGPNDGIVLLADSYIPGSTVYASFGNDHYFSKPFSHYEIAAFLAYIVEKKF